jgi:outer membrane protein
MGVYNVPKKTMLLAAGAATIAMAAVPAMAETLEQAALRAYENNPSVEIQRAVARANDELVTQAESAYGPQLEASASHAFTATRTVIAGLPTAIKQDGFATNAQVTLTQPLFTSGRLAASLDSAEANARASREDVRDASQSLLLQVIGAYLSVRRDIQLYEVAAETYDLLLQQRNLTQSRLALRDATAPDVDQTASRLELAAGRVLQARADLEVSAATYRELTGSYPDTLAPPPALPPLPPLEELYAMADTGNPRIVAQRHIEDASRAQLASTRAAMGPQISAEVNAGRFASSPYLNEDYSEQVAAAVQVDVPLYTGGRLQSRRREAVQRNIAAQFTVEETRRDVRNALASDWNRMRSAEMSLPRFQAAVAAAQRAVDGVKRQETAGIRTLRDVLDVTNDLFVARSNAVSTENELYFRHAAVLQAAGMLTIDLFANRTEYDPASYDPALADLAGLPFGPVLDPFDNVLLNDWAEPAGVTTEADIEYEEADTLRMPLQPMQP